MLRELDIKSNLYNFSINLILGGRGFNLKFNYSDRAQTYSLDILDGDGILLEGGLPCIAGVQLNRRIVNSMSGILFFRSEINEDEASRLSLGDTFKLYHYERPV